MCGIALVLTSSNSTSSYVSNMSHRGPNGSKTVDLKSIPSVSLSLLRLAIMPPNEEEIPQPFSMTCGQQKTWLVVNGEIYNYREIFHMLEDNNSFVLKSQNDCESILAAYHLVSKNFFDSSDASRAVDPMKSFDWFVPVSFFPSHLIGF